MVTVAALESVAVEMQPQCTETLGKTYTTIIFRTDHYNYSFSFKRTAVTLMQEPRELLYIRGECTGKAVEAKELVTGVYKEIREYWCKIYIEFETYLWIILKNYGYEVICKVLLDKGAKGIYHHQLFSDQRMRTGNKISFSNRFYSTDKDDLKMVHICFKIHRYNINYSLRTAKNLLENLTLPWFFKKGFASDVSLTAGDKTIPAHRKILAAKSIVFKAMFSHEMSESKSSVVRIESAPEVVEEMLFHIYTGKTKNLEKFPHELFELAHTYQLHDLQLKCQEYMLFNIDIKNIIGIRDLSILYELEELKEAADVFVHFFESELVKDETFRQYLCQKLNTQNLVNTLKLCIKYEIQDVKICVLEYIKDHHEVVEDVAFLKFLDDNLKFAKELFIYVHRKRN